MHKIHVCVCTRKVYALKFLKLKIFFKIWKTNKIKVQSIFNNNNNNNIILIIIRISQIYYIFIHTNVIHCFIVV